MSQDITIPRRLCVGHQLISALSAVTPVSLTVPDGAVSALVQADGGVVRVKLDGGVTGATAVSATAGLRLDDGVMLVVDNVLSQVRLLAQSGSSTNVQIAYFDKI